MKYSEIKQKMSQCIKDNKSLVILGYSGFGKTSLLHESFDGITTIYGVMADLLTSYIVEENKNVIDARASGKKLMLAVDEITETAPDKVGWYYNILKLKKSAERLGAAFICCGNRECEFVDENLLKLVFDEIVYIDTDLEEAKDYLSDKYSKSKVLFVTEQYKDARTPRDIEKHIINMVEEQKPRLMKSLQFELWQECNNRCSFCYLGEGNKCTPDDLKIKALERILWTIDDPSIYFEHDNLSYIGGEFFQGQLRNPKVRELFMELMHKTANLLRGGIIKSTWLAATLIQEKQDDLWTTLDIFKDINPVGLHDGFWLTSSYDVFGRFHTPKAEENWKNNMKKVHQLYPNVRFNITMILTDKMVNAVNSGELDLKKFMEEYHTCLFFKQPSPGYYGVGQRDGVELAEKALPGFFPKREAFIEFLTKIHEEIPELYPKLFNIVYRADELYRNFNDENRQMLLDKRNKYSKQEVEGKTTLPCGHLVEYAAYADSDDCMICDKLALDEMLGS